jgi:hypothetical protein
MIKFKINEINESFYLPEGRHEVTLEQWNKCFAHMPLIVEAKDKALSGDELGAEVQAVEYSARIISILSGAKYEDILNINTKQLSNLFEIFLAWFNDTRPPKTNFTIKGRLFSVPDFSKQTAGEFMDCMSLLTQINSDNEIEKGLVIASIYCRENGAYVQDLEAIKERQEFFKKYARMDFYYSCSFFLQSSLRIYGRYTMQPLTVREALERVTSTLNVLDISLCLRQ